MGKTRVLDGKIVSLLRCKILETIFLYPCISLFGSAVIKYLLKAIFVFPFIYSMYRAVGSVNHRKEEKKAQQRLHFRLDFKQHPMSELLGYVRTSDLGMNWDWKQINVKNFFYTN